jgi:hypothetical protein
MDLTFLRILSLYRKEIRNFVLITAAGGILQMVCRQYLENHPEYSWEKNKSLKEAKPGIKNKNRNRRFRALFTRGGSLQELWVITELALNFLSRHGLMTGVATAGTITLSNIPASAISTYLSQALPQNLPELERKRFILIDGEKTYLDQCDQNIGFLFKVLKDTTLPFEEKEKLSCSILRKYLNLKTASGRLNFVLCIVSILSVFSIQDMASYHIILKNLIKAIKEGRIPKIVGRAIIRIPLKRGLLVNPELLEVVNP